MSSLRHPLVRDQETRAVIVDLGVFDDSGAATAGCEAERPADEDEQPILEADQVPEVDDQPGRPGGKAAQPDAFEVGDCRCSSDRG